MKILKYKKGTKGKCKVYFDNGVESVFYEEVILKYNLLIKKEIDEATLIEIDQYNQECDVYYVALRSIENRFRSVYELKGILMKKEYPMDLIDKALDKLIKQGYLNDRLFAKSYINNQIVTTNKGPFRIEKDLTEKMVDSSIIHEELLVFSEEEQITRIQKIIEKGIRSNHNRGGVVLKQKIYNDLKLLGYDIFVINSVISHYTFDSSPDIAKKEYEKYYRKYSRKYQGEELNRKIQEKLYLKGLKYENYSS